MSVDECHECERIYLNPQNREPGANREPRDEARREEAAEVRGSRGHVGEEAGLPLSLTEFVENICRSALLQMSIVKSGVLRRYSW